MNSRITLQELQMVEVNVLNEFIKFCDDNDLKYFVVYGTLLGTIRHNGIIPWDDDIVDLSRKVQSTNSKYFKLSSYNIC